MEEFDLKDVWSTGHQSTPNLKSVDEAAKENRKKSLNIVNNLVRKSKIEWISVFVLLPFIFLIVDQTIRFIIILNIPVIIVLFVYYIKAIKKVSNFKKLDTLEYLKSIDHYLDSSIQKQIKIAAYGGYYGLLTGILSKIILEIINDEIVLDNLFVAIGIGFFAFIIGFIPTHYLTKGWCKKWIKMVYGKQLKEIKEMISTLEEEV
ncbi:hypothetical protein EI427_03255 [Flammeovirga pectinis]|uniref:Uncharacterized protein n=1 Tax=Flammeovirga pectinis TaxID=2494373 RepID=A0A3Q9FJT6_9BACT|nr:hypothetical protein [Flammeovirga pectinis]AZQ61272.1 hypothetical protein EI427_03255 [Flammeovirga pectinis]